MIEPIGYLQKLLAQYKKHTLSYLYLYKIAKLNSKSDEMAKYKKIINQLDSNMSLEKDE